MPDGEENRNQEKPEAPIEAVEQKQSIEQQAPELSEEEKKQIAVEAVKFARAIAGKAVAQLINHTLGEDILPVDERAGHPVLTREGKQYSLNFELVGKEYMHQIPAVLQKTDGSMEPVAKVAELMMGLIKMYSTQYEEFRKIIPDEKKERLRPRLFLNDHLNLSVGIEETDKALGFVFTELGQQPDR